MLSMLILQSFYLSTSDFALGVSCWNRNYTAKVMQFSPAFNRCLSVWVYKGMVTGGGGEEGGGGGGYSHSKWKNFSRATKLRTIWEENYCILYRITNACTYIFNWRSRFIWRPESNIIHHHTWTALKVRMMGDFLNIWTAVTCFF